MDDLMYEFHWNLPEQANGFSDDEGIQIEEEPEEDKPAEDEEPKELTDYGKEVVRLQKEHKDEDDEFGSDEDEVSCRWDRLT